jgi:capsular exopolysaccharide synthesis family protein
MSRIHEALKRAEQEKAAGIPTPLVERRADARAKAGALETATPPASGVLAAVSSTSAAVQAPSEAAASPIKFEELWAQCSRRDWTPDPNLIVFGAGTPFVPGAEQFRTLRSRLYRMRETQPLQTILISSAIPAEGKTVVSSNLAYALVRQQGCRVLLVDADLRSPRVHTLLGTPAAPGLADYLQNTATEFQITQRSGEEGFCFIPAGNHVTHPSELISSDRMKQFLDRVKPAFDWIIIDSPPALPVADASVLGGLVDGVLLVVRAGSTPSEASVKACKELRDSHILGVVLNSAEESAGYNSYYASGYGSGTYGGKK